MRNYQVDYAKYTFKSEDNWGDYYNGEYREPYFYKGYSSHRYLCNDGKWRTISEHIAKWEFFNGKIPDGMEIDHIVPIKNGGTNNLSNLRLVDRKGNSNNETTIKNLKIAATKRWGDEKYKNKMFEIRNTDEYKTHQKIIHLNNNASSKKVAQYDKITGELIKIWPSTMEVERNLKISNTNISACCLNKKHYNSAGGFKWGYVNDQQ